MPRSTRDPSLKDLTHFKPYLSNLTRQVFFRIGRLLWLAFTQIMTGYISVLFPLTNNCRILISRTINYTGNTVIVDTASISAGVIEGLKKRWFEGDGLTTASCRIN